MRNPITDIIAEKGWCVAAGATGSTFLGHGLEAGYPPDLWCVEEPEVVLPSKTRKSMASSSPEEPAEGNAASLALSTTPYSGFDEEDVMSREVNLRQEEKVPEEVELCVKLKAVLEKEKEDAGGEDENSDALALSPSDGLLSSSSPLSPSPSPPAKTPKRARGTITPICCAPSKTNKTPSMSRLLSWQHFRTPSLKCQRH